jgi:hypothetical protein
MKTILTASRDAFLLRLPIVAVSALVGFTASALDLNLGVCIVAAVFTQVALFTLQSL